MPGRVRTRKLSAAKEGELKLRVLDVLNNSDDAMTLDDIKASDITLAGLTTQKLSRVIGSLVEIGLVRKSRSKTLERMVYKTVSKMIEQGYDVGPEPAYVPVRMWKGVSWEIEDERPQVSDDDIEEKEAQE